jgi:DNA replication and repair protein RecF
MASLDRLTISSIRNIDELSIELSRQVNLIHGSNGSGKTTILEAIHMLGVGRSFRSTRVAPFIQQGKNECILFASLDGATSTVGLQKFRNQRHLLRLQGRKQGNWIDVARSMPLQILDSSAFQLLDGSPKVRRRFLDWGVFHVEHAFLDHWRNSRICISNRNQLLKSLKLDKTQLKAWSIELCNEAEAVDQARTRYFNDFSPILTGVLAEIALFNGISLRYHRGWDEKKHLSEVLIQDAAAEQKFGQTLHGPHKADIQVKIGNTNANELLSRGQQKILVSAMKIAQGLLFARQTGRNCIYLIDDLPAELDEGNRVLICKFLLGIGSQLFITSVDKYALENCWDSATQLAKFHVEHGKILP